MEVTRGDGETVSGSAGNAAASASEDVVDARREEKFIDLKQCEVYLVEYPEIGRASCRERV